MSDDIVWQVIGGGFCSYKVRSATSQFCRNENNVTGLCNRLSCPLANSRYATIREIDGICYLYKKVVERAHLPARMWEKIKLKGSPEQIKNRLLKELEYMPDFFKAKCQQRYERIQEYLRRIVKLENDPNQPVLSVIKKKVVKREAKRENRAKQVALIENVIERELLGRLQKGVYGDIYNLPQRTFEAVLNKHGQAQELEEESMDENEDEVEYVENEEEMESDEVEYLEEFEESEDELTQDVEDIVPLLPVKTRSKRGAYIEVEYEDGAPQKQHSK